MTRRRSADRYSDLCPPTGWPPRGEALTAAIRALNHPARRSLLDALMGEGPASVGHLARRTGLAVGSVSYHIRILAEAGFVEPAPELAGDTRESWWRAIPRVLEWSSDIYPPHSAGDELARLATDSNLSYLIEAIQRWRSQSPSSPWAGTVVDAVVPATEDELAELGGQLAHTVDEWAQRCRMRAKTDPAAPRRVVRAIGMAFPEAPDRG